VPENYFFIIIFFYSTQSSLAQEVKEALSSVINRRDAEQHPENLSDSHYEGVAAFEQAHQLPAAANDSSKKKFSAHLKKGNFHIHIRSNFMQTINRGGLLDYHTLALGGGLGYTSPQWKGFQVGFSGFFVFQIYEHNLTIADPSTGSGNRYEITLYDMNNPENKTDLDRLEDLYIIYKHKGFMLKLGRQKINTPLLNEQDNRMRPSIFSGALIEYRFKNWDFLAAFFNQATLRGTLDWYTIEESFGVYPFGRNPLGGPESYKHHTHTKGIALLGGRYKKETENYKWKIEGWNYFVQNVFNTTFLQTDLKIKKTETSPFLGLQGFFQTAVGEGGSPEPTRAYILPQEKAWAIGGRAGISMGKHTFSLNFLHIGESGRFLFPREWGREVFYASLPRERFEGNGDLNALTLKYNVTFPIKGLYGEIGVSQVNPPALNDVPKNKYGLPAYYHFLGQLRYKFDGYLEGLNLRLLIVNKTSQKPKEVPESFRINRVDLWHINFIIDYLF
jgi:hypothetical protein